MTVRGRTFIACVAALTVAGIAHGAQTLQNLANNLAADESLAAQLAIVDEMRALIRERPSQRVYVDVTVYALSRQPVFAEENTMQLLREMLASPDLGETTVIAIANQYAGGRLDPGAAATIGGMLLAWQRQQELPDKAVSALMRALNKSVPRARREQALGILLTQPPAGDQQEWFLRSVASLLEPEISSDEKYRALEILQNAAATRELPRAAESALSKVAASDPDPAVRVAAWEFLLPRHKQSVEPGDRYFLGSRFTNQLTEQGDSDRPSFATADEETREHAVSLLIDYWHPDYPPLFADALVSLVANHGSPASVQKLEELRRANRLNADQLAALAVVRVDDPDLQRSISTIAIPNLAAGSLVGPLEVIANSRDPVERQAATRQLLAEYPSGPVPMQVADAAYQVMAVADEYDAAAVALVVRADESFASRESKILALADGMSQQSLDVVKALQHLHGDAGLDFVVRRYATDEALDERFRATIVSMLYMEVRDSGVLDPDTAAAVSKLARTADRYSTIDTSARLLRTAGYDIGLAVRLREKDVQWKILGWAGLASLAAGTLAGLLLLVLVALPGTVTALDGRQRLAGFGQFVVLAVLFVGASGIAVLHSIGHNSAPPPNQAAPWYLAVLVVAALLAFTAVRCFRVARRARRAGREVSRNPGTTR